MTDSKKITIPTIEADATYSTEGHTLKLIQRIQNTEPPLFPKISPGCIWDIPENLLQSFDKRYADWVFKQISNDNFAVLENISISSLYNVNIIPGKENLFLVTIPRLECYSTVHFAPGASVYVMDQTGTISQIIDRIGQPYPEFEKRVWWDGEKWIMLAHQTDLHWGGTSEQFTVFHISNSGTDWHSTQFELEDIPRLYRPFSVADNKWKYFARFEDGIIIGNTLHTHCDAFTEDLESGAQTVTHFKFDGERYRSIEIGYELDEQFVTCKKETSDQQ